MNTNLLFLLFLCIVLNVPLLAESTAELINTQEYSKQDGSENSIADREYYVYFGPDVCTLAQDLPLLHKHMLMSNYQCDQIDNVGTVCNAIAQGKTTAPLHVIKAALYEAAEYLRTREPMQDLAQVASNLEVYLKKLESGNVDILVTSELNAHDNARDHVCRSPGCTDYCVIQACKLLANSAEVGEHIQVYGDAVIHGNEAIGKDLTVCGSELVGGDLTVLGNLNATIDPVFSGNLVLRGTPQQACIVFVDAQLNEKARICSSPIVGDKGVFVSVNQGATQNLRVTNAGGVTIAAPTSGAALSVTGNASAPALVSTGNGTSAAPALQLLNNPASTPTDFLLTIDNFGVVREGTVSTSGAIINGCQPGPVTIGTADATALTLATNGCTDRLSINANGAVTIATPDAGEVGLTIAGGGETIIAGDLELVAGNVILPVANAAGTQGLVQLGGVGPTNVSIYESGTRNLFAGNGAVNATVTGTDNISIGTDANNTLTTANNTIAIGTTAQASGTDSIALGNEANTAFARSLVIGSADSTSTGAGPSVGTVNAIALGSASGTLAGPSALGNASMAIGSSDGFLAGATASGDRGIALGVNARSVDALTIAVGSGSGMIGGAAPAAFRSSAIAIGSARANRAGASTGSTPGAGLSAVAIGASDGVFVGADAGGNRSIAIGVAPTSRSEASILIGSASGIAGGLGPATVERTAIAIGSAQGSLRGANAGNISSIAIGGSDGIFAGAAATGARSIAIGVNANTVATSSLGAIILGSASGIATGFAPTATINAIAVGSAQGVRRGATASSTAAIALGGSDGSVNGASATVGARNVAIGTGASTTQADAIVLGNTANTAVRVGVGIDAPAAKIDIVGANNTPVIILRQGSTALTSAPVWLNPSTSAAAGTPVHYNGSNQLFGFTSSRRYKTNIRSVDTESEVMYQLTPVIYDSKEEYGEGKDIAGFIAEDVYTVAPNLVVLNSDNQPETLAYSALDALIVKELQKHQHTIMQRSSILEQRKNTLAIVLQQVTQLQAALDKTS